MCLGIPAQIVELRADGLAQADVGGVKREVSVALIDGPVEPGDWVLLHVGFALGRIDEDEARETLAILQSLGEPYEQELADIRASCLTCGDTAVEARVVEVRGDTAVVEVEGHREEVAVDVVPDVRPGDLLLCHAGLALEKLA
jgi:hydrogenase expression/formation protein HypC